MNHPPSRIVQELIVLESAGLFNDPEASAGVVWPLYISSIPQGTGVPNDCGCVYDTAGELSTRMMASGFNVQKYGIQVKTRSMDPNAAFVRLRAVALILERIRNYIVTLDEDTYVVENVEQSTPPVPIGEDERRLAHVTLNLLVSLHGEYVPSE